MSFQDERAAEKAAVAMRMNQADRQYGGFDAGEGVG
jgi:hypothetical protein